MILKKFEFLNEITDENEKELAEIVKETEDKINCVAIESYADISTIYEALLSSKQITSLINDINGDLGVKFALLVKSAYETEHTKTVVKLYDEEPAYNDNLIG